MNSFLKNPSESIGERRDAESILATSFMFFQKNGNNDIKGR